LISGTDQSGKASMDLGVNSLIERVGAGPSSIKLPLLTGTAYPRHLRGKVGCTTPATAGSSCTGPQLTWSIPFSDLLYTTSCTLIPTAGQPRILAVQQSLKGVSVTIVTDRAVASTGTVSCIAVHD